MDFPIQVIKANRFSSYIANTTMCVDTVGLFNLSQEVVSLKIVVVEVGGCSDEIL